MFEFSGPPPSRKSDSIDLIISLVGAYWANVASLPITLEFVCMQFLPKNVFIFPVFISASIILRCHSGTNGYLFNTFFNFRSLCGEMVQWSDPGSKLTIMKKPVLYDSLTHFDKTGTVY